MRTLLPAVLLLTACAAPQSDSAAPPGPPPASIQAPSPAPATIQVYRLQYADAQQMAGILQEFFPPPVTCEGELVSPGVHIRADPRTNSLVVSADSAGKEVLPRMADLIQRLDIEVKPGR